MTDDAPKADSKPKPKRRRRPTQADRQRNTAGCMGVIALIVLGIAGVLAFNTWSFIQRAEVVEAIVIDVEIIVGDEGDTYRPVFGFAGPNGPVEASPKVATSGYDYDIGDAVEIRYDPDDPSHAIPTGSIAPWLIPIVVGSFGGLIVVIAALTFISAARADRRRKAG